MLDHGVLNVPLAKRGNIDAQINRYKATEKAKARAAQKDRHNDLIANRVEAKRLVADMTADRAADLAERCKVTVPALVRHLNSEANWNPRFVLKLLGEAA